MLDGVVFPRSFCYPTAMKPMHLKQPLDWKAAIRAKLKLTDTTRYAFIQSITEKKICSRHTAECLLADNGTVTGDRIPTLETAIEIAKEAGFRIVMVPHKTP